MNRTLTLTIKNQTEELSRLSVWVSDLRKGWGLSDQILFRLDLVLAEAVSNIILYAYPDQDEHQIVVLITQDSEKLTVDIIDDGTPYNPLRHPLKPLPDRLSDAEVGGLGIHIVQNFSDSCSYRREKNRNILTLILENEYNRMSYKH